MRPKPSHTQVKMLGWFGTGQSTTPAPNCTTLPPTLQLCAPPPLPTQSPGPGVHGGSSDSPGLAPDTPEVAPGSPGLAPDTPGLTPDTPGGSPGLPGARPGHPGGSPGLTRPDEIPHPPILPGDDTHFVEGGGRYHGQESGGQGCLDGGGGVHGTFLAPIMSEH